MTWSPVPGKRNHHHERYEKNKIERGVELATLVARGDDKLEQHTIFPLFSSSREAFLVSSYPSRPQKPQLKVVTAGKRKKV